MEAFSLLKYWRGGGGSGGGVAAAAAPDTTKLVNARTPNPATTIVAAVAQNAVETDDDDDDDGPFFDLEFAVPDEPDDSEDGHENPEQAQSGRISARHSEEDKDEEEEDDDDDDSDGSVDEREFKFTLSPSSNDRSDPNFALSPSDDLFFKGKLVQVEPSSFVLNSSEPNSKSKFNVSLLKSATKFRVFMLGLKKSKTNASEKESSGSAFVTSKQPQTQQQESLKKQQPEQQQQPQHRKFFTVKFKVEEVPIKSLFTRDNSSRIASSNNKSQNQNMEESPSASDEKRFSKEVMQKYLKMVKPLYIRVSRRYGDKLRFSGPLNVSSGSGSKAETPSPTTPAELKPVPAKPPAEKVQLEADASEAQGGNAKILKQGNLPAGLRVVCKHLGKSRSATSAVAAAPSGMVSSKRRDDSLIQQQDGIQGAILHCKRSFNASRECNSSQLPRSVSDPSHEISLESSRKSTENGKNNPL